MFGRHKTWWSVLVGGSALIAMVGAGPHDSWGYVIGSILDMIILPAILAAIPVLLYRLVFKSLTSTEFLSIYTAAWAIVAMSQLLYG